jgi:hypothetical protein
MKPRQPSLIAGNIIHESSEEVTLEYGLGLSCSFTRTQFLKLAEIKKRPARKGGGVPPCDIPWDLDKFSSTQKRLFCEALGDVEGRKWFGDGPWLLSSQRNRSRIREHVKAWRKRQHEKEAS